MGGVGAGVRSEAGSNGAEAKTVLRISLMN